MIERLKSGEALIAAIASLGAAGLQYFAIPSIIDIPENISPLYQYLTTGLLVVLILIVLLLLPDLSKMHVVWQAITVLALMGAGMLMAISLVNQLSDHSFEKTCLNQERIVILAPSEPTDRLQTELMRVGGAATGWCNHPDTTFFRALLRQDAVPDATNAGLKLLGSQLLFALGLISALLFFMARSAKD